MKLSQLFYAYTSTGNTSTEGTLYSEPHTSRWYALEGHAKLIRLNIRTGVTSIAQVGAIIPLRVRSNPYRTSIWPRTRRNSFHITRIEPKTEARLVPPIGLQFARKSRCWSTYSISLDDLFRSPSIWTYFRSILFCRMRRENDERHRGTKYSFKRTWANETMRSNNIVVPAHRLWATGLGMVWLPNSIFRAVVRGKPGHRERGNIKILNAVHAMLLSRFVQRVFQSRQLTSCLLWLGLL